MSNCIQVENEYCPFRLVGDEVQAWVEDRWQVVEQSDSKNEYGEFIFNIAE